MRQLCGGNLVYFIYQDIKSIITVVENYYLGEYEDHMDSLYYKDELRLCSFFPCFSPAHFTLNNFFSVEVTH